MAKYTKQISHWAKIFTDTFVNESTEVEENDILKGRNHSGHLNETEPDIDDAIEMLQDWLNNEDAYVNESQFMQDLYCVLTGHEYVNGKHFTTGLLNIKDAAFEIEGWFEDGEDEDDALFIAYAVYHCLTGKSFNESKKINEATPQYRVDDKYIKDATTLLEPLKAADPELYLITLNRLNSWKGKLFAKDAKAFALSKLDAFPELKAAAAAGIQAGDTDPNLMDKVAAANKAAAPTIGPKEQQIKSIWVKDLIIDPINDSKSIALLELEYVDGSKEDLDFNIGTTGPGGNYVNADRLYKDIKRNMPGASDKDIRLSMVRIAFNDYRIKWFYGPTKIATSNWSFDPLINKVNNSPVVKANKSTWLEKTNKVVAWKSGNTTIYRTEAEKMDESILSFFSNFNKKFSK